MNAANTPSDRLLNEVTGLLYRLLLDLGEQSYRRIDVPKETFEAIASSNRAPLLLAILRAAGFIQMETATSFQLDGSKHEALLDEVGKPEAYRPVTKELTEAIDDHGPG